RSWVSSAVAILEAVGYAAVGSPVGPPPAITTACSVIAPLVSASRISFLHLPGFGLYVTTRGLPQAPRSAIFWEWQRVGYHPVSLICVDGPQGPKAGPNFHSPSILIFLIRLTCPKPACERAASRDSSSSMMVAPTIGAGANLGCREKLAI